MRQSVSGSTGAPDSRSRRPPDGDVDDPPVAGDDREVAGQAAVVDVAVEVAVDAVQALRVEAEIGRIGLRGEGGALVVMPRMIPSAAPGPLRPRPPTARRTAPARSFASTFTAPTGALASPVPGV